MSHIVQMPNEGQMCVLMDKLESHYPLMYLTMSHDKENCGLAEVVDLHWRHRCVRWFVQATYLLNFILTKKSFFLSAYLHFFRALHTTINRQSLEASDFLLLVTKDFQSVLEEGAKKTKLGQIERKLVAISCSTGYVRNYLYICNWLEITHL